MSCKVIVLEEFKRDAKKLVKKYRSLKQELADFQVQLQENPRMGTLITENTYKVRLAVKSKGKGKRGGLRVLTYVVELRWEVEEGESSSEETTVFLLTLYDKSDMENISDAALTELVETAKTILSEEDDQQDE